MGVKNLWPVLAPICERKSLFELYDKAVAIDLSCWVCESTQFENTTQPRMYLRYVSCGTCLISN
jgi:flap endonuclease GEN